MHGKHAWPILAAFVIGVDLAAIRAGRPTMSEALDDIRGSHPAANVATLALIGVTAGHLTRALPKHLDPFRLVGLAK